MSSTTRTSRRTAAPSEPPQDRVLARIRGEYLDMPGLQLTAREASRLLGLESSSCGLLLDQLTHAGFLRRRERGHYVLATER